MIEPFAVARHRFVTRSRALASVTVGAALAASLVTSLAAMAPADAAAPSSNSTSMRVRPEQGYGPGGAPFVGESFTLSSDQMPTGSAPRAGWSCSVDLGDGRQVTGEWDAAASADAAPCTVQASYDQPGSYDVTMTVEDPDGATHSDTESLQVATRPSIRHDWAIQGERVTQELPPTTGHVELTFAGGVDDPGCKLEEADPSVDGSTPAVTCFTPGTHVIWANDSTGAASGELVLPVANAAPSLDHSATYRQIAGRRGVRSKEVEVVHTGDVVRYQVAHMDPGVSAEVTQGDQVTCDFADTAPGDGTDPSSGQGVELGTDVTSTSPWCSLEHVFTTPGRHTLITSAHDASGALDKRWDTLDVQFRRAEGLLTGHTEQVGRFASRMRFTRGGLGGRLVWQRPDGSVVRAGAPSSFAVWGKRTLTWRYEVFDVADGTDAASVPQAVEVRLDLRKRGWKRAMVRVVDAAGTHTIGAKRLQRMRATIG
ncbi:PKD domain-containing protein [Nocardioides acrostichi]|uniref:PKD domain-containing protein n=1 Tax=Nocardioides acrostichi TaxID=2784339 RepID=A0A930Y914_9ACTN|nr:PKD domain-containing protein [Nocardioides acrostichi]MBF4163687.1 PKD domain-containing protein [Nocardioides acrostichi]